MKLYRVLTGIDDSAFCHRVTAALNKGWSLEGPPQITAKPDGTIICAQAVVKDVPGVDYVSEMKLSEF
ncbi:MAG: DUF1737 domain-containing protein [Pseudomonadota bacterium]